MKLAMHYRSDSFSDYWIIYLLTNKKNSFISKFDEMRGHRDMRRGNDWEVVEVLIY